jgi:uncharacterized protein
MLATKPDVNSRDAQGRTPLHVATFAKEHGVINTLAKAGADLARIFHRSQ